MYQSTKTYGNDLGLSACFRQWRADHSHCSLLHGYSLGFRFTFEAIKLDRKNWVYDFGGCKWIKKFLEDTFDHKLVVAEDDCALEGIKELQNGGVADIVVLPDVGCEKFAEYVYNKVSPRVRKETDDRVHLYSVECFEHGANSAIYYGSNI